MKWVMIFRANLLEILAYILACNLLRIVTTFPALSSSAVKKFDSHRNSESRPPQIQDFNDSMMMDECARYRPRYR